METNQTAERRRIWHGAVGVLLTAMMLSGCQALHVSQALQDGRALGEGAVVRAELNRPGATPVPVLVGSELRAGDLLTTGTGTFVELLEPSGTRVLVYPQTTIEVSSIFVHIGKIFVRVRGAFQSGDRDDSVAGAEGTSFLVRVENVGAPAVYTVLEGAVNVRSRANLWPLYRVVGPAACQVWRGAAPTGRNLTREEQNRFIQEVNALQTNLHGGGAERLAPSVVGLSENRAADVLSRQGLRAGERVPRFSRQDPPGTVVAQEPAPGEPVRPGDGIRLEVATLEPAPLPTAPRQPQVRPVFPSPPDWPRRPHRPSRDKPERHTPSSERMDPAHDSNID